MFWLATKTLRTKSYSLVECQRMMFFIKKKKLILKLKCFMNVEQRVLLGQYRRVYIYLLHRAHRFKGKRRDEHKKTVGKVSFVFVYQYSTRFCMAFLRCCCCWLLLLLFVIYCFPGVGLDVVMHSRTNTLTLFIQPLTIPKSHLLW